MQALLNHSEENNGVDCLKQFDGEVKLFEKGLIDEAGYTLKVPHMGWNQVAQVQEHPLWNNIEDNSRFYFVHSFYAKAAQQSEVMGRCHYGLDFDVALNRDNLFAVQFHPEKSHTAGLQLLRNFLNWDGSQ
jgi:glutamine amidotransferase